LIPTEGEKVQCADHMDLSTFCLHMTHRHRGDLAGMWELKPMGIGGDLEEAWRIFHDRLHDTKPEELGHFHERRGHSNAA